MALGGVGGVGGVGSLVSTEFVEVFGGSIVKVLGLTAETVAFKVWARQICNWAMDCTVNEPGSFA